MKPKLVVLLFAIAIIIIGVSIGIWYFTSTFIATVSFTHATNVHIVDTTDGGSKTIQKLTSSPATLRLSRDVKYQVTYDGSDGYANGSLSLDDDRPKVSIDPDYSSQKYSDLMSAALPSVSKQLSATYPKLDNLYTVDATAMRGKGQWFVVSLVYKDGYDFNSDTLHVLFKKQGTTWHRVTDPAILFTTVNYPDVPYDILKWSNSQS